MRAKYGHNSQYKTEQACAAYNSLRGASGLWRELRNGLSDNKMSAKRKNFGG
jgi:hypothetical protein